MTAQRNRGFRPPVPGKSLADRHPELVAQWHPTKNDTLTPDQVRASAALAVWWKCAAGPDHEWELSIDRRSRGEGCPFCSGYRPSETNSVASVPELAAQWHPTKNGDLTPETVVATTTKKLWWKCAAGPDHEWQASGDNRCRRKSGCPFCDGKRVSVTNTLARFPEVVAQWHPTKNSVAAAEVPSGSTKRYWWKCEAGPDHEWQTSPQYRTQGRGCPFCAGRKVSVTNSVASIPELAAQWHPAKNGDLRPQDVVAGTNKPHWWKCADGPDHEWRASGNARLRPSGCPFCRGLAVSVTNSLANYPDLAAQWHPTKNSPLTPDGIVAGSHTKAWWQCANDPSHVWQTQVKARTQGRGCPACAEPGYNPSKPGCVYVLGGEDWGKVGISNVLAQRLAQHITSGVFGPAVLAVQFTDGVTPMNVEQDLCAFIAERTTERAPRGVDGYTESFPVLMLGEVEAELHRLLGKLPKRGWSVLDHPPPPSRRR